MELDHTANDIFKLVTANPGLDDEEIADRLGLVPVEVSVILRRLEEAGLVNGA